VIIVINFLSKQLINLPASKKEKRVIDEE